MRDAAIVVSLLLQKPAEIIEIDTVKDLLNAGEVVIASGGGGIPVIRQGNHLKGVGAVIDKDFASCLLAQQLNADFLIILTAVEKVALRFGTPEETWLDDITVDEAKQYMEEGHFAPGSMLPKVQAGVEFAESGEGTYRPHHPFCRKQKTVSTVQRGTRIIKK